jgi:uncharacterized protein
MITVFIHTTNTCNSSCSYCFAKKNDKPEVLNIKLLNKILFILTKEHSKIHLIFHGGEPLIAGFDYFKMVLESLNRNFDGKIVLGIQSNLSILDSDFINLFQAYNVKIGTSLDGPEFLNNRLRGISNFSQTIKGINFLQNKGIPTGCVSTITKLSIKYVKEIFDFFSSNEINFTFHPVIIHDNGFKYQITAKEYSSFLIELFDIYIDLKSKINIHYLDSLVKSVFTKSSNLCLHSSCISKYLAIAANGNVYPCNRFVGNYEFSYGNVNDIVSLKEIYNSEGYKKILSWYRFIEDLCSDCLYYSICYGGCPYQSDILFNKYSKDKFCESYKSIFKYITELSIKQIFDDGNLNLLREINIKKHTSHLYVKGSILDKLYS